MLNNLKREIAKQNEAEYLAEAAINHASDDDVKDIFLDSIDAQIDGAEDDPEIENLIDDIPEYGEEEDEELDDELEELTENFVPETKLEK